MDQRLCGCSGMSDLLYNSRFVLIWLILSNGMANCHNCAAGTGPGGYRNSSSV